LSASDAAKQLQTMIDAITDSIFIFNRRTTMNYASPGTIIHGTLRNEDLLDAFTSTLEDCITRNPELPLKQREIATALVWDAREADPDSETASELINDLIDALQEFAPPGHSFGAHEGDGADFGFWPVPDDDLT